MVGTVVCPHCGGQNSAEQRFCGCCGAGLARLCPVCGERNQPIFRFCGGCGAELRAVSLAGAAEVETEERRWMTIMFADLSGFTSLAERSDPEDVRLMVDRCMNVLADVVHKFGGTVHQIAGDALLAVFGAPVAHEDDAERAVRAGLEMQRRARTNADDFGGLSLHIGVNTGEVMFAPVGPIGRRDQAVVGDIVNTAARLQTSAPASAILVGEETWRATHSTIEYEPVRPLPVKNKARPVAAWRATDYRPTPMERFVTRGPMVGRNAELKLLRSLWHRADSQARAQLVAVAGPAGIGKSRLCREFQATVHRSKGRYFHGRSLPYGESTAYGAFAQIVKSVAGILETDSAEIARAKLAGRLTQLVSHGEADIIAAHLAVMVGLASEDVATDRQALFSSAARLVEVLAAEQATIFYFEDTHWAEPSLLDLVEFLARNVQQTRTLLLMSTRPELFDARPHLVDGQSNCVTITLGALSESAAEELTKRMLGNSHKLSASTAERLRAAAGGNPLFIEELAASLAQGATDPFRALPANLKTLITARIDSLHPEQRRVILDASVVGSTFWRGTVAALRTYRGLDGALESLEAQGLIQRQRDSRLESDIEFSFKHAVIRDVAYGILPKAIRRKHHTAVAGFIENAPGARTAETTLLLAHHWQNSLNPRRAVDYLVAAAKQAGRGWAKQEAVALYNQALELLPDEDPLRPQVAVQRAVAFQGWLHMSLDLDRTDFDATDHR
jgi:class 3 adenylate cyclase